MLSVTKTRVTVVIIRCPARLGGWWVAWGVACWALFLVSGVFLVLNFCFFLGFRSWVFFFGLVGLFLLVIVSYCGVLAFLLCSVFFFLFAVALGFGLLLLFWFWCLCLWFVAGCGLGGVAWFCWCA